MEGSSQTLKGTLKVLGHVTKTALSEFLAGFVANGVDRILKARAAQHKHVPMAVAPAAIDSLREWAVITHTYPFDKQRNYYPPALGLRVCAQCKLVYYDEVPPPAP